MQLNLNQVTVSVKDVEASIRFYEKLGLKLIVKALPHYARFECVSGDTTFSLHQTNEDIAGTATWIYFETENIDEDVDKLIQLGIKVDSLPADQPWLWREARCKDPDGNSLIFYYAGKNRKYPPWRINTDER
jgi:catechol 2,3-dioxygenase-like lactoylglutathione lyase family enzyme